MARDPNTTTISLPDPGNVKVERPGWLHWHGLPHFQGDQQVYALARLVRYVFEALGWIVLLPWWLVLAWTVCGFVGWRRVRQDRRSRRGLDDGIETADVFEPFWYVPAGVTLHFYRRAPRPTLIVVGVLLVTWHLVGVLPDVVLYVVLAGVACVIVFNHGTRQWIRSAGERRRVDRKWQMYDQKKQMGRVVRTTPLERGRGFEALIVLPQHPPMTWRDIDAEKVRGLFGAKSAVVRRGELGHQVRIIVRYDDPLAARMEIDPAELVRDHQDAFQPVAVGEDANGRRILAQTVKSDPHVVLGGPPGAGKTSTANAMLIHVASDPEAEINICDGKGDLQVWGDRLDAQRNLDRRGRARVAVLDVDAALAIVLDVEAEMDRRLDLVAVSPHVNVWTGREHGYEPFDGLGLVLLLVDELPWFLQNMPKVKREEFERALGSITSRGRSAGVFVVITTQRTATDVTPVWIRGNMNQRYYFGEFDAPTGSTIFGEDAAAAAAMSANGAGRFVTKIGGSIVTGKGYYLDPLAVEAEVEKMAERGGWRYTPERQKPERKAEQKPPERKPASRRSTSRAKTTGAAATVAEETTTEVGDGGGAEDDG